MVQVPPPDPPAPTARPLDVATLASVIVETSLHGYVVLDLDLRVLYANPAMADQLGTTVERLIGRSGTDLIHPHDQAIAAAAIEEFLARDERHADAGVPLRFRLVRDDGSPVTTELGAVAVFDHPDLTGFVIRSSPLRGQGEIDAALAAMARDADLAEVLDLLLDGIDGVAQDGRAALVVEELPSRAQWSLPDDLPAILRDLPDDDDPYAADHPGRAALDLGTLVVRMAPELRGAVADTAEAAGLAAVWAFPLETRAFRAVAYVWRTVPRDPLISSREVIERILGIIGLAIERHRARIALEHAATHDPLTGLPNRAAFASRLGREAERPDGEGRLGVLYLDLDGFKPINDRFGHLAGDVVLRDAAARIDAATRDSDVVARLGGDEFAVLCPDIESPEVLPIVAARIIAAFDAPFDLPGGSAQVGVSIGIATAPLGDGVATDADTLLAHADAALYEAKRAGRGRWALADPTAAADTPPLPAPPLS